MTASTDLTQDTVSPRSRSLSRVEDIEVLRAVAVLMTLIGHSSELMTWAGPVIIWSATALWGGVDLFFCISGFVISRTLINSVEPRSGLANFLKFAVPFWIKRIFRIWPAAFFWLAVTVTVSIVFRKSGAFGSLEATLRDALASALHVANLHYLDCLNFKAGSCYHMTGIYWSLSLEEQFYFLFPFLLFAFPTRRIAWILMVCILLQILLPRPPWSIGWAIRSDALMFGVLIAIAQTRREVSLLEPHFLKSKWAAMIFFAILVAFIAVVPYDRRVITTLDIDKPFVWFNTGILAILCAIMVFVASFDKGYTFPNCILKRILVYIGSRSFALYICHNIIYFLIAELFRRLYPGTVFNSSFSGQFILVGGSATLIMAELTYRYIESPLRQSGRDKASRYRAENP